MYLQIAAVIVTGASVSSSTPTGSLNHVTESTLSHVINQAHGDTNIVLIDDCRLDKVYNETSSAGEGISNLKSYFDASSFYFVTSYKNINYIIPKNRGDRSSFLLKNLKAVDCANYKYEQMIKLLGDLSGCKLYVGCPSFNARECLYSIHGKNITLGEVLGLMAEQAKANHIYIIYPLRPDGEILDHDIPMITIQ